MKVYIDLQKLAISKVVDATSPEYQGDINSNVFEILFFNFSGTNWFPTMSQLAPNGREAGDFEADTLGQGETHDYTEDGVSYKRYTFTMGDTWVLMNGRSNLYVWYNVLEGSTLKKCVGKLNVMINESSNTYFISNPLFNPSVKNYIDGEIGDLEDELNDKIDAQNATIASLSQASPSVFDTTAHIQVLTENKGVAVATDTGYIWYWDSTLTTPTYVNSNILYQSTGIQDGSVDVFKLDDTLINSYNLTFEDTSLTEYQKHSGSKFSYNATYNLIGEQTNQWCDCIVYEVEINKVYKIKVDARTSSVVYGFCNNIPTTSNAYAPVSTEYVVNIPNDTVGEYIVKAPANCYLLITVKNSSTNYGTYELTEIRAKVNDNSLSLKVINTSQEITDTKYISLSTTAEGINDYIYKDAGVIDSSSSQFKSIDTEIVDFAYQIEITKTVGSYGGAFLDASKNWISSFASTAVGTKYSIPKNAKYVNITINMSATDNGFAFITKKYYIPDLINTTVVPNSWYGKKILCLGTSVSFGSGASESYIHYASEQLGFELINTSVPGEAIHINQDGTSLTWGSTSLSISEYASQGITIANDPITPIVPNGNYNNYYRTWEHIFDEEHNDIDLYVFDVIPNNTNFDMTDWDDFNRNTWTYNTGTFADHRKTFLGALLFLLDKMYENNPNSRCVFVISSSFGYSNGKAAFETIANSYNIPIINLWGKINTSPKSIIKINQENGTNQHPTTFAHEIMGKMFIGELLKVA